MTELINVEKANENNLLWPPIADALDTFLKRRTSGGEGYEKTWRLIHVWEAIVTTLSELGMARLREEDTDYTKQIYRKCREHLYGRSWDLISKSFNTYQGALDGSAMRRLDILMELSSNEASQMNSPFLKSLYKFLISPSIDLSYLIAAWARVCEVPDDSRNSGKNQVRNAMKQVNTFRNRFAHVPFPYDGLDEIADALENVTEQLFSIEPMPWQIFPDERIESPLTGAIHWKDRYLRGNMPFKAESYTSNPVCVFPAKKKKVSTAESWNCQPFIYIDSMVRPYILTRLLSHSSGRWEFTRFRAEANSVIQKDEPGWLEILPIPIEAEYRTAESSTEDKQEADLIATLSNASENSRSEITETRSTNEFEEALRQIRNSEYEPAIDYFSRLVEARPEYHVGWLRLGHAQRELAVRMRVNNPEKAKNLFAESTESLTKASSHLDPNRGAQALYECSKTYYHWGRFINNYDYLGKALENAETAYALSPDTSYETWIDYLKRNAPITAPLEKQVEE